MRRADRRRPAAARARFMAMLGLRRAPVRAADSRQRHSDMGARCLPLAWQSCWSLYAAGLSGVWRKAGVGSWHPAVRQAVAFGAGWITLGRGAVAADRRVERSVARRTHGAARAADGRRGAAHRAGRADDRDAVGAAVGGPVPHARSRRACRSSPGHGRSSPRRHRRSSSTRSRSWVWHIPRSTTLRWRHEGVHVVQHVCFLRHRGALLVGHRTRPSRPGRLRRGRRLRLRHRRSWRLLGALLTFSPRVWYAPYLTTRTCRASRPLEDQQLAGPADVGALPASRSSPADCCCLPAWLRQSDRRSRFRLHSAASDPRESSRLP